MARFDQGERVFLEAIRSLTISSRGFRWHAGSPSRFPPSGSPRGLRPARRPGPAVACQRARRGRGPSRGTPVADAIRGHSLAPPAPHRLIPQGRPLVMLPPLRRRQRTIVALDGAIQLRLAASPDPSGERVLEDFAARHLARQPIDLPEQRPVDGDRDLRFGRHGMTIYRTIRRMTSRPATPPPLLA